MHLYLAANRETALRFARPLRSGLVFLSMAMIVLSSVSAQSANIDEQTIQDYVRELACEKYMDRQIASRELTRIGGPAIPALLAAVKNPDPELRMRVVEVLAALAVDDDEATRDWAQREIGVLAESDHPDVARLAGSFVKDLGKHLQVSALAKLSSLGAITSVEEYFGDFASVKTVSLMIGPEWKGTRADLNSIRWLRELTNVTLVGDQIDDELIQLLTDKESISNLVIKRAAITDASMKSILQLPNLRRLQLVYCDITDACYDDIASLPKGKPDPLGSPTLELLFYGTQFSTEATDKLAAEAGITIDRRNGAFLGVYFAQGNEPCVITRVVSNSAASLAGIEVGDTILRFADREIKIADDFRGAVSNFDPGDEIVAVILRGGKELELKIELGKFQDIEQ